ncbi:VanZ family protein [Gulosibacter molinativorax]|uniref:VanZ family protein n=1 Tax=Gulosibacter molinativorax TaxID=256821 RepID=A0ABT7C4I8_9MICO|nr:VanZ family protein [Gulosibacter molinativorax]MDJ1370121.1 VanZ family protein [Gulosibacter molinativorax]QUY63686.1 Hypotetical protein [Gulosibacter molinativorax]
MGGTVDQGVDDGSGREPRRRGASRTILWVAFGLCVAGVLAIVFLPIGWMLNRLIVWLYYAGKSLGMPGVVTLGWYEFGLNVLLFAVPVALASLLWRRVPWWVWPLLALVVSGGIEVVQLVFLPREFSLRDVVANTLGAVLGAAVVALARARGRRKVREP